MNTYIAVFTIRDSEGMMIGSGKAELEATTPSEAVQQITALCQADTAAKKELIAPLELADEEKFLRDIYARDIVVALITSDLDADKAVAKDKDDPRLAWQLMDSDNFHHAKYAKTAFNIALSMIRQRRSS